MEAPKNPTPNTRKTMKNKLSKLATTVAAKAMNLGYRFKNTYNSTFQKGGVKGKTRKAKKSRKTRKMRRGTKRMHKK